MSTLKDIAGSLDPRYGTGTTTVWYMKPPFFRDGIFGSEWLVKQGIPLPTIATIEGTHTCVGTLDTDHPEEVWMMMQGEQWSPQGQANGFIRGLGLQHTSMSVGDIVQKDDVLWMVEGCGFKRLP
jgi:hypothetical protein